MKFLVLSDLNQKLTRVGSLKNNSRGIGAYYVTQKAREFGIDATNIDYFLDWPRELLLECILTWFGNEEECVIGYSGSIDASGTNYYKELTDDIRKHIPQLKVMLGGFREPTFDETSWIDIMLIGRCTNLLLKYLKGEDISEYQILQDPPCYRNPLGVVMDDPVAITVEPNDFWSSRELMTIETALGCKFNCTFCGYDYRNNKNPKLNNIDTVIESMQTAYDVAGITNFFLADDTINEVDNKLELLGEVKRSLTFEPDLMSFVRMDIIGSKPHQIDLMRECNLRGHFYGIESLNPAVTKSIRKGGKPERNYEIMRRVKAEFPEAFTYGNFVIGLTGDSEEDIWKHANTIVDEQLLTSAGCTTFRLYSDLQNDEIKSDIDKDPAKFGYSIIDEKTVEWDTIGYESDNWKNDWTTRDDADKVTKAVDDFYKDNLTSVFTSHEIYSVKTLLPGLEIADYNNSLPLLRRSQKQMMNEYIRNKSEWLMG